MKNFGKGLMTLFNSSPGGSHYAFYNDIGGRLFQEKTPPGTSLSNGEYALFHVLNDVDWDTFSENLVSISLQFSLFSGDDSSDNLTDMDSDLSTMIKDKVWAMTGATVVHCHREQGDGPRSVPANTEAGTQEYWIKTVDFTVLINRD